MENERTTEKKQVFRNFMWATIFLLILCFAAIGILFYIADSQSANFTYFTWCRKTPFVSCINTPARSASRLGILV